MLKYNLNRKNKQILLLYCKTFKTIGILLLLAIIVSSSAFSQAGDDWRISREQGQTEYLINGVNPTWPQLYSLCSYSGINPVQKIQFGVQVLQKPDQNCSQHQKLWQRTRRTSSSYWRWKRGHCQRSTGSSHRLQVLCGVCCLQPKRYFDCFGWIGNGMTEVIDCEIEAHLFRLMRSDRFKTGKAVLEALQAEFVEESEDRIKRCAINLLRRIKLNN